MSQVNEVVLDQVDLRVCRAALDSEDFRVAVVSEETGARTARKVWMALMESRGTPAQMEAEDRMDSPDSRVSLVSVESQDWRDSED